MKLLLTSAGLTNQTIINELLDLTGKQFTFLKAAFIPTAANVEEGDKGWLIDNLNECKKCGFDEVDIVDIAAIPVEMSKSRLEYADVLVFGGGNTSFLMKTIEEKKLRDVITDLLSTRVYVGISAGSMIPSQNLVLTDSTKLYGEEIGYGKDVKGLGYVPFHVRPHYKSEFFPLVNPENLESIAKEIPEPIYAIDDNTALKVIDGNVEVISEGEWEEFNI